MTQASPQLRQFVQHSWQQVDAIRSSHLFKRYSRILEASKGWLLWLLLLLFLWIWNWQLVLSGGLGLAALVLVYLVQQGQWQLPQINWQALWKPSNRALTLGMVSGIIVCFSTYLILAVWQESSGSWLAKGMILEGLGILAIGLLLIWQRVEQSLNHATKDEQSIDQWLNDLSAPDALKRLIAVRRLTHWMTQNSLTSPTPASATGPLSIAELAECFRLMLDRETEPMVCRALLDSVQTLNPKQNRSLQSAQGEKFCPPERAKVRMKDEG